MNNREIDHSRKYLELLARSFQTAAEASTEIINLQAILNLPKGTEHFLADIHGEYEAFQHVLKNASGNIKRKVNEIFGNSLRESEKRELCTLIYYPEQKLELVKAAEADIDDWYHIAIHQLVLVCRDVSSKYTRSKVRKNLPGEFSYIIQELLHERTDDKDKSDYVSAIIDTIISTRSADDFIIALCHVIQRLIIDQLHILGDVYDRGPGAHIVMDTLLRYHSWDITWGNHDILWMGAAAGNDACICNVIRIALRYANMTTIEEGYAINLIQLATFAMDVYGEDPCEEFLPKLPAGSDPTDKNRLLTARMHKAISVIEFKVEAALQSKHPRWHMAERNLLEAIDYEKGTCTIDGVEHPMRSCNFPTVDPADPNKLTPEEEELMKRLHHSFRVSEKLQKHIHTLLSHGSMYNVCNGNLLYHAAIPLNADGTLKDVELSEGKIYKGRELFDQIDGTIRTAFQSDVTAEERQEATDYFYYLWCGPDSPLFDKAKMTTFERYFIADKATHVEPKGNYFKLRDDGDVVDMLLDEFGVTGKNRHVINGHVPVHVSKGEDPIKAGGKLMVIDGGFSSAYHKETGIAGYTLVFHSRGFELVQHEPFTSAEDAVMRGTDIVSTMQIVEMNSRRLRVADTDKGLEIKAQIEDLKRLLHAFRHGYIKERERKRHNK